MSVDLPTTIVIISIIFSVVPLVPVILRFYVRHKQHVILGLDDYLIIPGVAFTVALGICIVIGVYYAHDGQHVPLTPEGRPIFGAWYITFEKLQYAQVLLSVLAFAFIKASILMMYRRIFFGERFRIVTSILLAIVCCWGVAFVFAVLLACVPISKSFDSSIPGHCINKVQVYDGFAISNLIIDVMILTVPQPIVWKLKMSVRRKVAVSGVFLLGGLVVGISAARIYFYYEIATPEKIRDTTYSTAPGAYWTHIDASVAVICACLPAIHQLFASFSLSRILNSFASKISLRHHSNRSTEGHSLPEWEMDRDSPKDSTSSTRGLNYHRAEACDV